MCDKVHVHGALAAVELTHNGPTASNLYSREVLIAPSHQPSKYGYPAQARAMDRQDIANYRRWHREAALRGMRAGMDIVYVYCGHDLSLAMNHADHVVVLGGGRVVAQGTAAEALREAVLRQVWGVDARWIGEAGQRALVAAEIGR